MNILFCRLVKKVNRLFPLFVFFSLMGQAINVSEMAHKITKKKKTPPSNLMTLFWLRRGVEQDQESLQKLKFILFKLCQTLKPKVKVNFPMMQKIYIYPLVYHIQSTEFRA